MGSGIAFDEASIVSVVLEGILYGFSLLMFIGIMWGSAHEHRSRASKQIMISIATVLLVLSTAHMVFSVVRIQEGLVKYRSTFPGGPVAFFEDVSQWTYVTIKALYLLQTLVGDAVVIYRCYVAYQSVWIIVPSSILWCSSVATGIGATYGISQVTVNSSYFFSKRIGQWATGFLASTLVTNLLSSGLIAYRIWTVGRNFASVGASKSKLMPIVPVIIDAALLYSVTLFIALICLVTAENGEYVVANFAMPIISIAVYMVLIRFALGRTYDSHYASIMLRGTSLSEMANETPPLQAPISQVSSDDSAPPYRSGNGAEREPQCLVQKEVHDGAARVV